MKYWQFWNLGANWSTTARHSDYSTEYPVVDYTTYAANFEQFRDKYPFVIIETTGQARADCCFGNPGAGHFGPLEYETIYFNHSGWNNKYAVYAHKNDAGFDVGAEIGFGFRKVGNLLYLRPFINGWINSVGYPWRTLQFGLGATSITFHPSKSELSAIVFV